MIVPGALSVNAVQGEKVRGAAVPGVPHQPRIVPNMPTKIGQMPRYVSMRKPKMLPNARP